MPEFKPVDLQTPTRRSPFLSYMEVATTHRQESIAFAEGHAACATKGELGRTGQLYVLATSHLPVSSFMQSLNSRATAGSGMEPLNGSQELLLSRVSTRGDRTPVQRLGL